MAMKMKWAGERDRMTGHDRRGKQDHCFSFSFLHLSRHMLRIRDFCCVCVNVCERVIYGRCYGGELSAKPQKKAMAFNRMFSSERSTGEQRADNRFPTCAIVAPR